MGILNPQQISGGGGWGNQGGIWSPFANHQSAVQQAAPTAMDFINPSIQAPKLKEQFQRDPQSMLAAYSPAAFAQFPSFYGQGQGWDFQNWQGNGQPPTQPPTQPPMSFWEFPSQGYFNIPSGAASDWLPPNLPTGVGGLNTYNVDNRAYLIPNLQNLGLPAFVPGQPASGYTFPSTIDLDGGGHPARRSLFGSMEGNTGYEPMDNSEEWRMARTLHDIYAGSLVGMMGGPAPVPAG